MNKNERMNVFPSVISHSIIPNYFVAQALQKLGAVEKS